MSIFDKRVAFKPFEYPEVSAFKEAIQHSYWLVSEWNFASDVDDFKTKLTDVERSAIRNTLLAIAQIEVAVKKFWILLGDKFPKAEIDQVGVSFGESEVRHSDAYSKLLEILGMNDDFTHLSEKPAIQKRVEYLQKYLQNQSVGSVEEKKKFTATLSLFSLFIENVSLFSQFAIIKSFHKNKNLLKDVDNVIQSTLFEEQLHATFGAWLINQIRKEFPHWFNDDFYDIIKKACKKSYVAEKEVLDWIFENGELEFLTKDTLDEFLKQRFNDSLEMISVEPIFNVDKEKLIPLKWFNEELYAAINSDFFHKKPNTYSKRTTSINAGDLF